MKSMKYFLWSVMMASCCSVFAQEAEISDEDLKNYAVVMDSIEDMRQSLLDNMSESIKNNENITAARYNELSKIIKDSVKLQAASATEAEIKAINKVQDDKDTGAAEIQETFKTLVKDLLGAATYNKVKKALSTNPELKTKYEALLAEINKNEESD